MLCYPPDTDWSCAFTPEELAAIVEDPTKRATKERSEALAWYTLASLCGYQIGVCPTTVRPCAARCAPSGSWMAAPAGGASMAGLPTMTIGSSFTPHISGGVWLNSCGCGPRDCSCGRLREVVLPGPVGHILSVMLDGEKIAPSRYRVDNGDRLVALDDDLIWPTCQDLAAGPGDPGAFAVTYYRGAAPNEMTKFAAGVLATEFYRACTGGRCRLPAGVTSVARNGVTYEIQTGLFAEGYTGIREVDAVIRIYNPNGLKQAPRVITPESRTRTRRATWRHF